VYRQVSILSQENKTPLRRSATKGGSRPVVAIVTPRPELLDCPSFFWSKGKPAQRVRAARAFD
jgi:hypothetical protein